MRKTTARQICCKSCRLPLDQRTVSGDAGRIDYGVLVCPRCATGLPVLRGFVYADHPLLADRAPGLDELLELESRLLPNLSRYAEVLGHSAHRSHDAYAAFQPFNESTRAIYPLLDHLRRHLKPDDLILDTWCRTGFSGALLAGLFPEQRVLSLWEGNLGVLGYEGFQYWLPTAQRASNWDIMFTNPGHGLPFLDESFALIHALDSLHRYPTQPFLGDCLRTAAKHGALIFPHVHLSNSEPLPFFERGGLQLEGDTYRRYFEQVLGSGRQRAYVLSERKLFELERAEPLRDDANTSDYNGLIAVLDVDHIDVPLSMPVIGFDIGAHPFINPLVRVDPGSGATKLDECALGGAAADLLLRHPCYEQRLAKVLPRVLSRRQAMIWTWLQAGARWADIGRKLACRPGEIEKDAREMAQAELVTSLPIGPAMARLQQFHAVREVRPALPEQTFGNLWAELKPRFGERTVLAAEDGSRFSVADTVAVVSALTVFLAELGIGIGDRVALVAGPQVEAVLVIWACWLRGAVISAIDPGLALPQREALLQRLAPALTLVEMRRCDDEVASASLPALWCSSESRGVEGFWLSDRIAEYLEKPPALAPVSEGDAAVILFTSGSTGQPKGVVLSQGALFRGARSLAKAYEIGCQDVLACPGGLHSMSGLRNNCILPLLSGATLAVLDGMNFSHPRTAAAACRRAEVTVLSTVPAFVHALDAVKEPLAFGSLRQILCTGSTLLPAVQRSVEQRLGWPIQIYYGLTETGGICSLLPPGSACVATGDIGVPVDAQFRIVSLANEDVRAHEGAGLLEIYSANLMLGYFDEPDATCARIVEGWLRTGDLARCESGHFILAGRVDEMFKTRQGDAVHPGPIEELLISRDDVADAVVVGVDSARGPRIEAWLVAHPSSGEEWIDEVKAWLSARLDPRLVPDRLHRVDELLRAGNGKVARAALRAQVLERERSTAR